LTAKNKDDKYNKIKEKKVTTTIESLTRGYPEEFSLYLQYCRNLKFEEKPDYAYLRKIFKDSMYRNGYECDYQYDWVILKSGGKLPQENGNSFASVPNNNVLNNGPTTRG
jgi:casein kinase 1